MDNQEISELFEQYEVNGSQSEIPDVPLSPGSQDSISNIRLDFDPNALDQGISRLVDSNDLDFSETFEQLPEVNNYKLHVSFESQTLPVTKSAAWTFSEVVNRLYVNISQPCPIRVRLEPCMLSGAILRCFLRYLESSYAGDPVEQCANHTYSENNSSLRGHVLRCKQVGVQYENLGRYSLSLPLDRIQDDVNGGTFVFEFKCLSTCPGLGRRAMELVFQVESSGSVVCCQSMNVRVCACPGRDRKHEENLLKATTKSKQTVLPHSGPLKRHLDDNEEFTIKVKGRKNYEFLLELKQRLEMADAYERLRESQPRNN